MRSAAERGIRGARPSSALDSTRTRSARIFEYSGYKLFSSSLISIGSCFTIELKKVFSPISLSWPRMMMSTLNLGLSCVVHNPRPHRCKIYHSLCRLFGRTMFGTKSGHKPSTEHPFQQISRPHHICPTSYSPTRLPSCHPTEFSRGSKCLGIRTSRWRIVLIK